MNNTIQKVYLGSKDQDGNKIEWDLSKITPFHPLAPLVELVVSDDYVCISLKSKRIEDSEANK